MPHNELVTGNKFPPKDQRDRLSRYRLMDSLYRGDRAAWKSLSSNLQAQYNNFDVKTSTAPDLDEEHRISDLQVTSETKYKHYKLINLFQFIVNKMQQLIFNKPIRIKALTKNEDANHAVTRLIRDTKLREIGVKAIKFLQVDGDAVFKLRVGSRPEYKDDPSRVIIDSVPPEFYFPEFEPGSDFAVSAANIAFIKTLHKSEDDDKKYLMVERHEPGEITYFAYELQGEEIGAEIEIDNELWKELWGDIKQTQPTGVDRILVWHVPWNPFKAGWGVSEYNSVLDLLDDMNKKLGGLSHMHDIAASPRLKVPESSVVTGKDGMLTMKLGDVIPMIPGYGDKDFGWIEINGAGLTITMDFLSEIQEQICMVTSAPRSIFSPKSEGGTESGVAIEKKAVSTALQAGYVIGLLTSVFEEILFYAQRLEVKNGLIVELPPVKIVDEQEPIPEGEGLEVEIDKQKPNATESNAVELTGKANYIPERVPIEIQFGLSEDETEVVDNAIKKLLRGLTTREEAIKEVNPMLDPLFIQEFIEKIDADQAKQPLERITSDFADNLRNGGTGGNQTTNDLTAVTDRLSGLGEVQ